MKQPEELNRELLLRLLDYNEREYFDMVVDAAEDYLRKTLRPEDDFAITAMRKSKYFWRWWTTQWDRRNRVLIHEFQFNEHTRLTREQRFDMREVFALTHCVENLNVYPNRLVMEQTYAIMIGEVITNEMKGVRK